MILFILFVITIEFNDPNQINVAEAAFMVYALGFTLEKLAAMQEHGMKGIEVIQLSYMPSAHCFLYISVLQGNLGAQLSALNLVPTPNTISIQNGFDLAFGVQSLPTM